MIPYTTLFEKETNKVIQACAIQFEKNHIVIDQSVPEFENQIIPYKYLLLATGTNYPVPAKASTCNYNEIHQHLEKLRQTIKNSNSILIVGGGSVGIGFAGEIRETYQDKKITLVHRKDNVLDEKSTEKLRTRLQTILIKNDIQTSVVLPDIYENSYHIPDKPIETKSGKKIKDIDLVLLAFGNQPATAWLNNTQIGSEIVNENDYIKVKSTLQIDHSDLNNVFVLGDVANLNESKLASRLYDHVPVIINNLIQLTIYRQEPTSHYKKGDDGIGITFGSKQGAGTVPLFGSFKFTVGDWVISRRKGNNLLIEKGWRLLNAKPPHEN